MPWLHVK